MNKARRQEIKKLKYYKRLRNFGLFNEQTKVSPVGEGFNFTCYLTTGRPCSCIFCQSGKGYNRAKIKRQTAFE